MKYYIRQTEFLKEDLERGWSSWNFGQEGIECTEEELEEKIQALKKEEIQTIEISGFEIWKDQLNQFELGELYPNYWVVKDNENCWGGLACCEIEASTDEEALKIAKNGLPDLDGTGKNLEEMEYVGYVIPGWIKTPVHVFKEKN